MSVRSSTKIRRAWKTWLRRPAARAGSTKKICVTDPDATMATNARNRRLEPAYKQHTAVDDKVGVVLDVVVTTGQTNEGDIIEPQVDEVRHTTGVCPIAVTAARHGASTSIEKWHSHQRVDGEGYGSRLSLTHKTTGASCNQRWASQIRRSSLVQGENKGNCRCMKSGRFLELRSVS